MLAIQTAELLVLDVVCIVIFIINTITLPFRLFTGGLGIDNATLNI